MNLEGSHADVTCSKCHPKAAFKLAAFDNGECSQCHKSPHDGQLFGTKKCQTCHSAAFRSLTEVRFDHKKQTGYPLVAKHAQIECYRCHTKALGKQKPVGSCERCHATDSLQAVRFSHDRDSRYKLDGAHARLTCVTCHKPEQRDGKRVVRYKPLPLTCTGCHGTRQTAAIVGGLG